MKGAPMLSFLTEFELNLAIGAVAFIAGVACSTRVKDFIKGIPAQARVALNNVEAKAVADVKQAQADALARIPGAVPEKTPLPPSAAPLAPAVVLAPAPAPAPVAPAAPAV